MMDDVTPPSRILVLGSGPLAQACQSSLQQAAFAQVQTGDWAVDEEASLPSKDYQLVVYELEESALSSKRVRAVEQACFEAGVPCLFVASAYRDDSSSAIASSAADAGATASSAVVGPLVRDSSGCSACFAVSNLQLTPTPHSPSPFVLQLAAAVVLREAHRLLVLGQRGESIAKRTVIDPQGRVHLDRLARRPGCRRCGTASKLELRGLADLHRAMERFQPPLRQRARKPGVSRVGILGGGSAGYLAALVLRRKLPRVEVMVIASSDIPVIGVGEASTPLLPALLHGTLGLDLGDFFRRTQPTLKLGIHFDWGLADGPGFHYPFDRGPLLESLRYEGHINAYCPSSLLMTAGRAPLLRLGDGSLRWLGAPFAYHVDNRRFVSYLREEAERAGVVTLDRRIERAELVDKDGEPFVQALYTGAGEGERLEADLWIDASGFRSFLLGDSLDVPFVDFQSSLFTDAALVSPAMQPDGTPLPLYTTAATWRHGWSWRIPQLGEDHVGYVFSTAHATPEQAEREFRARCPTIHDPRLLRFRPGRRERAWVGNVVGLGNAYGFVEPLESTSLHMIALTCVLLVQHFPQHASLGQNEPSRDEPQSRRSFNRFIGDFWDELRWFLALHFKFNQRLDTDFWRACREDVDVQGAEATLQLFRERAPLSYRPHLENYDPLWGDFGRDVILMGQGVAGGYVEPRMSKEQWDRTLEHGHALVEAALSHRDVLELLRERPEIGWQLQAGASWLGDAAVGGRVGW